LVRGNALLARTNSEQTENVLTGEGHRRHGEGYVGCKRVLFVDDHALFRQILAVICEQHTNLNENVQAGSLAEARQVLSSRNNKDFALAVVDLDLPDEGGVELIRELRRTGIPVLALSASRDHERLAGVSEPDEVLSTTASYEEVVGAIRRFTGA
jgi:two-component system, OmpR family, catabolic regulation response regulator CreB